MPRRSALTSQASDPSPLYDALVIGAGPGGLTAAVYLARYRRKVVVVHDGRSRALHIPRTYNVPGFPDGVPGPELIDRMDRQARMYGAEVVEDEVVSLERAADGFVATGRSGRWRARAVILATGVVLNQIEMAEGVHEAALKAGCLRYCPICDGYEATDKAVAVLGSSTRGGEEALFLRRFTDRVTLFPAHDVALTAEEREELAAADVRILDGAPSGFTPSEDGMTVRFEDGRSERFDVVYPALGVEPRSELADQVGAELTELGCVPTDRRQRLATPYAYAVGDVVEAIDQISVAVGHGAIAATQLHNDLRVTDHETLTA